MLPQAADKDSEVFLGRAGELKEEGNKHYTAREHKKALHCYEQARAACRSASSSRAHRRHAAALPRGALVEADAVLVLA